jgi:hypothetical protein
MMSVFNIPSCASTHNQHPLATIIGLPFSVLRHKCGAVVLDISVEGCLRHGHESKYQTNIQKLLKIKASAFLLSREGVSYKCTIKRQVMTGLTCVLTSMTQVGHLQAPASLESLVCLPGFDVRATLAPISHVR